MKDRISAKTITIYLDSFTAFNTYCCLYCWKVPLYCHFTENQKRYHWYENCENAQYYDHN